MNQVLLFIFTFIIKLTIQQNICLLPNCQICTTPYICQICPIGLSCCQYACLTCYQQNSCLACIHGYTLNSSICQLDQSCYQPTCVTCIDQQCQLCQSGFVLNPYTLQCNKCPKHCAVCDLQGNCIKCQLTFSFKQYGICQSCLNFLNCLECDKNGCIKCEIGYYSEIYCQPCSISNCSYCLGFGNCTICNSGHFLSITKKSINCLPCSKNCTQCNGTATNCTSCQINQFIFNNTCLPCYSAIPFCLICQQTKPGVIICLACLQEFFLSPNNTCLNCPQNCLACLNQTICTTCNPLTYMSISGNCNICNVPYCLTCKKMGICLSCIQGYVIRNLTTCVPCPPNCEYCQGINNIQCSLCLQGYSLNQQTQQCYQCQLNCLQCTQKFCLYCINGFHVNRNIGECLPCPLFCYECINQFTCSSKCSPGFYLSDFSCFPCPFDNCYNCQLIGQNFTCNLCMSGYYFSQEILLCQNCSSNCLSCNNSNTCIICMQGYYVSSAGACVPCLKNCQICSNQGKCLICAFGFYLSANNGLCLKCPKGCNNCTSSINCLKCYEGYFMNYTGNFSVCQKCSSRCLTCTGLNQCTNCAFGFSLNSSGICEECLTGCLKCDFRKDCLTCQQGYAINQLDNKTYCQPCSNGCKKCRQIQSIKNRTIQCLQCQFGWTLLPNRTCFLCGMTNLTEGCLTCVQDGVCSSCIKGYVLNQTNMCMNKNIQYINTEWPLIRACIGLGCLAMVLLIILLFQKINHTKKTSIL